ncbi:MAG: hypothetical protein A3A27_00775 [Candidatus Wildermuthbacteria bacterium RIFCSPLOWO2_01_FULL_47_18]|uniref:Nucleotidase n=2 Tax=Candidatus Wildermuthiibacteriota TaxID=1817923 RepID=A0A1G2RKG6_9BACT|nr:MAG: hypothetical protein A3J68_00780 [Candidatus Wildermuthbacteria bacterium RIFCSPHIGHO2_02_FULL_48_16]OHA72998.1 MAG: hypothetical protein A3A27_00775 [Candidatus Wildermuthbacteria bacterium RIFCSPLOWO2_01_FULL_47_18]OHB18336.1 MAG: hypothetical protein A2749_02150 [Parcubacteria group bacterium RIFCSPHIGHO2_01_FULL_45_26]
MPAVREVLGVDIGGVIIDRARNDETIASFFDEDYLQTPAIPGAFDALRQLVKQRFGPNVFLVSRCKRGTPLNKGVLEKTEEWLAYHGFFDYTGINPENVRFCDQPFQKAGICREQGITYFVDDRLSVLAHMVSVVPNLFLFRPNMVEVRRSGRSLYGIQRVNSWQEVLKYLLPEGQLAVTG